MRFLRLLASAARHLPRRSQDHVHGVAFHARPEFHNSFVADLGHQPLQHLASQVLVGHFACTDPLIHLDKAFIYYAVLLNPPGKLVLLVELLGGATCVARLGDYNMGGWPDDRQLQFSFSAAGCETASCRESWESFLPARL